MAFLDKFKSLFESNKLDVSARFEFSREAIAGTMSKFRAARDIQTGKIMGLKLLDEEKRSFFEDRFKGLKKPSEGEIAVSIKHPRVVETYEYGLTTSGQRYILMEYVDGPGLNQLLNSLDERLNSHRLELIRQMAEAIEAVHQAGYIHRDICPRNFICAPEVDSLKLIDFGLTLPDKPEFRQPGNRTGTPLFMAPEIVRRRSTDKRVDLFALGVTAYRLCTFEFPWQSADTTGKAALQHDTARPTPILAVKPQLDKRLADAIMKCISPDPDKRPSSAEQFLSMIKNVTADA